MVDASPSDRDRVAELVAHLAVATDVLGALSAASKLRRSTHPGPPEVEIAVREVVAASGVEALLDHLGDADLASVEQLVWARLQHAVEIGEDPFREPGWRYTDQRMLESQGVASAALAPVFHEKVAPRLTGLSERLARQEARLLDVGVGSAGFTVSMCSSLPSLSAVGIDVWEPALRLARRKVRRAGLQHRVELRKQSVSELTDADAFDLVWVPVSFLPGHQLADALRRIRRATRPGGWVVADMYGGADELSRAVAHLRTARVGGRGMSTGELEAMIAVAGYSRVTSLPVETVPSVTLTAGRRPSAGLMRATRLRRPR